MNWYRVHQNNSHGYFIVNNKLSVDTFIEAPDVEEANEILLSLGAYFEGCKDGIDCSCCGDRWYPIWAAIEEHEALKEIAWACFNNECKGRVWSYPYKQEKVNLYDCFQLKGDYWQAVKAAEELEDRIKKMQKDFQETFVGATPWDQFVYTTKQAIRQHVDRINDAEQIDFDSLAKFFPPSHQEMLSLLVTAKTVKYFLDYEFEDLAYNLREALEELFSRLIVDIYHEVLAEYDEIAED